MAKDRCHGQLRLHSELVGSGVVGCGWAGPWVGMSVQYHGTHAVKFTAFTKLKSSSALEQGFYVYLESYNSYTRFCT